VILLRAIPMDFNQVETSECASVDGALRLACLRLGTGEYQGMSILDDGLEVHDMASIQAVIAGAYFHPESLIVDAHALINLDSRLSQLGLESVRLLPDADTIHISCASAEGPVYQATLRIPDWQNEFEGSPEELAALLISVLPDHRPSAPETITDKRYLFLRVLDDLADRCSSNDEYTMLGIAGLLRLLLWDGASLADQVNREIRCKLVFRIGAPIQPRLLKDHQTGPLRLVESGLMFQAVERAFHPSAGAAYSEVTRSALYSTPVLQVGEHVFTVLELMKHMAFVGGTIHALDPHEDRDRALHEFRTLVKVGGVGPGLRTLQAIGAVVVDALAPLRNDLLEQLSVNSPQLPV